jgi:hypothetical protein
MHQVLESEMRQVLAELSLLQYGSVQRWNASCGGDGAGPPAGESRPLAEVYWLEWLENPTRDTVDMARAELDERIVNLAAQGCTERQIAFQVGVGKSTVRRALGRAA